jgi:hypothetical protein
MKARRAFPVRLHRVRIKKEIITPFSFRRSRVLVEPSPRGVYVPGKLPPGVFLLLPLLVHLRHYAPFRFQQVSVSKDGLHNL